MLHKLSAVMVSTAVRACEAQHVVAAQQGKAEETRKAVPAETAWARFCCSTLNMKWTVISYYIVDIYSFPLTRQFIYGKNEHKKLNTEF